MYPLWLRQNLKSSRLRLAKIGLVNTRYRGRRIFGVQRIFVRICSNLPTKFLSQKLLRLFWKSHKTGIHVYYGEEKSQNQMYFDRQSYSSHNENKGVETSVPKCCGMFFHIFRYFARIFDKSKLLAVHLYPPASPPPTPLSELASRSRVETPSLLIVVLNTGCRTNSLKISMRYSC